MSKNQVKNMYFCNFCSKDSEPSYSIFRIVLRTNKRLYEFGLIGLMEEISRWLFQKMYHLSASQIILLRPDLLIEFFEDYKPNEKILGCFFREFYICKECYKDYKETVPVR